MLRRLRIKFVCINMAIVTLMLGVIFSVLYLSTMNSLERESIQMMQSVAARPVELGPPNQPPEKVRLPYLILRLGQGGELLETGGSYFDLSNEAAYRDLLEAVEERKEPVGVLSEYGLRYCRNPSPAGESIVFSDISNEQSMLGHLMRTSILIGVSAFLVFLGISILLARWAVRPVETAWNQQKQFVADASHELKTPLTVILTNAELLSGPDCGEKERKRFSGSILAMAEQMRGLVENLLELARLDNGTLRAEFQPLSLSELASDALLPFEPVFFERGMTLRSEIEPGITVSGRRDQLKQLADILLDNAQKYAAPGGETVLTLTKAPHNRCRLTVSNEGAPLSDEELKDLFKRFYRGDKARAMDHSYGLGLSIAQSIAEEHHGKIWAESGEGRNRFHVELPLVSCPYSKKPAEAP